MARSLSTFISVSVVKKQKVRKHLCCLCSAVAVQHDVHELNRILFDAIEESLKGTSQERLIEQLYKGTSVNQV